ncbi:type III pantothenate kinase [Paludibacterium denitrificans]|uniref:type III pantothenate kinase n=1 Tax=Paludibacterium denitrificans TaxID=2675226 RepID=UPI0024780CFA|nr:type III pantothenate kinase [Paludibacterium denitrificans]
MILLIDAGNSRVKWAIYQQGRWLADGVVVHDAVPQLAEEWRRWPLTRALASSVAEPQVGAALQAALPCPVQWVRAQAAFGDVTNHYRRGRRAGGGSLAGGPWRHGRSARVMWWWLVPVPP